MMTTAPQKNQVKEGFTLRIISRKDAEWLGMAASVAGGWIAANWDRRFALNLGGELMLVPLDSELATMGIEANASGELEELKKWSISWEGIDDKISADLAYYYNSATGAVE